MRGGVFRCLFSPALWYNSGGRVKCFARIFQDAGSLVTLVIIGNCIKRIWVRNSGVVRFIMIVRHAQGLYLGGACTCPKPTLRLGEDKLSYPVGRIIILFEDSPDIG